MHVQRYDDPAAFVARATPLLLRDEAENCFFLGLIADSPDPAETLMVTVEAPDVGPVAVAMKTPGRQVVITRAADAAIAALAGFLHEQRIALPGVGGIRESAEAFAREWTRLTGATSQVHVELMLHRLTQVRPPPAVPGAMRVAGPDDVDFLGRWVDAFAADVNEHLGDGREIALRRIELQRLFTWQDDRGEPVAMAGWSGPTPHGARINLVYTPPALRGRGYASNLVAALSRHLLDSGRTFCFLFTDLANPTSNKIYRKLGYEPIGESIHITFDGAAAPQ